LAQGYLYLARVLHAAGDTAGALDAIEEAKRLGRDTHPWYALIAGAQGAHIRLEQGDVEAAALWVAASGLRLDGELVFEYSAGYVALARVLCASDRHDEALKLLSRLLTMAEAQGAMGACIGVLALHSLVLQAVGGDGRALESLERALSLAEPEGYVRVFIAEGKPMIGLLRQAAARGVAVQYVGKLLSEWANGPAGGERAQQSSAPPELVEPLTERELEVLRLVAVGLANREIADQLYLALGTVKKHTSTIYGKLGVHNRTRAVTRAKELHLL